LLLLATEATIQSLEKCQFLSSFSLANGKDREGRRESRQREGTKKGKSSFLKTGTPLFFDEWP
jgi:hypothetical protein